MAANAIDWPAPLIPREAMFHPESTSRTGGLSMSGAEQITVSPSGRWRARLSIPLHTEKKVLAYRSLLAQLQGRAGTVLVPKWENFGPRDMNGRRLSHRSGSPDPKNFNLSGFGQSDLTYATAAANAAARATRVSVNLLDGDGPQPGQYFGLGERLYLCQSVWQVEEGDPTNIQFFPWLREAVYAGDRVILDRPVCLMRLADDSAGQLMMGSSNVGDVELEFVEAI